MPTKKVVNKTRKAVSKRFKVTASGKVKRNRQGKRHLLSSKSPKRRRRLGSATYVEKDDMRASPRVFPSATKDISCDLRTDPPHVNAASAG